MTTINDLVGTDTEIEFHTKTHPDGISDHTSYNNPIITNETRKVHLLGVYGEKKKAIYIHTIDLSDNTEKMFRDSMTVAIDEDRGISNYESSTRITRVGDVELRAYSWPISDNPTEPRDMNPDKKVKSMIQDGVYPYTTGFRFKFSTFKEPEFIQMVKDHMYRHA